MSDYKYYPDGDRVYWKEEYCNGYPCPVDCYRCEMGAIIEAEEAEKFEADEDESEEDTPDAG